MSLRALPLVQTPLSVEEAKVITGGLSRPSKMPGWAYGLPATACQTGAKLRRLPGTPCHGCYALKGNYLFPLVRLAQARRLASITHPRWAEAMAVLITRYSPAYFRWHDAGDIQSVEHLRDLAQVCRMTPGTKHWLPTQERRMLREYRARYGPLPANLCVRISAPLLNGQAGTYAGDAEWTASIVVDGDREGVHNCPSRHQNGKCGDCRACWDRDIKAVAYHKH